MKGRSIVFIMVMVALLFGGVYTYDKTQQDKDDKLQEEKIANWRQAYSSFKDLVKDSDKIALVQFKESTITKEVGKKEVMSLFDVQVIDSIYNGSNNETFSLQLFGENENQILAGSKEPTLKLSKQYVLFMHQEDDGTYQILNPQGVYLYENGELIAVSDDLLEGNSTLDQLREAVSEIKMLEKK